MFGLTQYPFLLLWLEGLTCIIPLFATEKDCGKPMDIQNTHLVYEDTTYGSPAQYTCIDGYEHEDVMAFIECLPSGECAHVEFVCNGK